MFDEDTQCFDHYFDLLLHCEDDPGNRFDAMIAIGRQL